MNLDKMYFAGEYGFAFRQLLPFLENYNKPLTILTWYPITQIINILWPGRYKVEAIEKYITNTNPALRNCNDYEDPALNSLLMFLGYHRCYDFNPKNMPLKEKKGLLFPMMVRKGCFFFQVFNIYHLL